MGCLGTILKVSLVPPLQPPRPEMGRESGTNAGSRPLLLTSTLPVGQVWGHNELPPLSHTHALQAPVQTFNHFVIAKGGLLRGLIVVAVGRVDSQVSGRGV